MALVRNSLIGTATVMCLTLPAELAAQRLQSGPQVLTFFSDIDDTEQPYGLYLPPDYDATKAYPLVISLHGAGSNHRLNLRRVFGRSNAEGENDVEASRYFPAWQDVDYIVAAPLARGTMGYQGVAEKDVMDVLADVKRRFSIDENRVYLTGLSMGGGGTLWIGLTRPDLWAAIAPVCPAPPGGAVDFAPNALHVRVHIFQGGADPVVQPEGVRQWVERFEKLGTKVEYTEFPGVGHDSWVKAYADGQIFNWFDQFRRDPHPDRVRFVSDRYAYNSAYWVRLDALVPGRPAHIDAAFTADNHLEVTTDALDGFTLSLSGHPRVTARRPVSLEIDGQHLEVPAADSISFSLQDGEWVPMASVAALGAKRPGLEGPMSEAIASRHVYVYGTAGNPTREELAVRREQAEHAANWSVYRGPFMGRVMVYPRVAADREVRPSDLADANLVLFGTPETNTIIAEYQDSLPMHLNESATADYGLTYVFPIGSKYALVNEGRPWWDAEAAGPGSMFANAVVATQLMNRQDYFLFDAARRFVLAEGRFDRTWHLPGRQAAQLRGSGAVLVHDGAIGTGQGVDIAALLDAMTLEEKLSLVQGSPDPSGQAGAGYIPGVPRLGIPPLRLSDGPAGIRTSQPATALPAPVALAASFDPQLARRFGQIIGREGRARNQDVLLSPMVNIVRVPEAGRNFETFGEDPLLASRMVAEEIRGIEGEGLVATVKHYVANNFEQDRRSASADVDRRTLNEIYLPGFEAAVDAGVGSVMCAYNRVNGVYACDHEELLTEVLRNRWGFQGWVMTDWGANHSLGSLEAGLDQEMPGRRPGRPGTPFGDTLRTAVETGEIPEALVDRAAGRILGQMHRMGLLDGSAPPRPAIDVEAGAAVAREVAVAGAVLLRNEGNVLPLRARDLGSVVVIGPTATIPLVGGGGSSRVNPLRTTSLMDALESQAGTGVEVRHVAGIDLDGVPIPATVVEPAGTPGARGWQRTGPNGGTQIDAVLDFTGVNALPVGPAMTWSGTLTAPTTGDYEIKLQTRGGSVSVTLDGERFLSGGRFGGASLLPTADGLGNATATVRLEAGVAHSITVSTAGSGFAFPGVPGATPLELRLAWVTPERREAFLEEAVDAARSARTAVVLGYDEGSEGRDRTSLGLPGAQDDLIAAVGGANRRTVVLVQSGSAVLMPWLENAAAVLQVWYPGQEGGEAAAALLLGEAVPGGKLPVTFPRAETDAPTSPPERYPGLDGHASYDEGVLVGYRWYDAQGIEPMFPFGHGLSYTRFAYDGLDVRPAGDGFDVTFRVRNAGDLTGDEVPQVYLGPPSDPAVSMAPKQLVGFDRITLKPGERRQVTVHIDARQLAYWSTQSSGWARAAGERAVSVGASSRDIRLEGTIQVPER